MAPSCIARVFSGGMVAIMLALLAACGAGSAAPASTPAPPAARPLVLTLSGEQQVGVGGSVINAAISPNARTVTYTSSDPRVARVDASGKVDTWARGTTTITATETGANAQSISYTVRVLPAVLRGRFVDETSLRSTHTGITYPYNVYLPAGYATSAKAYPVIYMTDGQWASNLYQIADRKGKEVILVLIFQGPDNRRMIDYTETGAGAYMRFLKSEMAPLIESTYRTNGERSFFGISAGGTLGAILLANEPVGDPYFRRYILADGAFHLLTAQTLQQEMLRHTASSRLDISIFLSGTRQANLPQVLALSERYTARSYTGMTMRVAEYAVTHEEMGDPTFIEALDTYY